MDDQGFIKIDVSFDNNKEVKQTKPWKQAYRIFHNEVWKLICNLYDFINPSPAVQVCKAFANSLEPDQTQSNSASGQVPNCLQLS